MTFYTIDAGEDFIDVAIERWRGATMSQKRAVETSELPEADPRSGKEAVSRLAPDRYRLLKKPPDGPPDFASAGLQRPQK